MYNTCATTTDCPLFQEDISRDDVIMYAALAAKWHEPPKDALDTMVLGVADLAKCDAYEQVCLRVCFVAVCHVALTPCKARL
jgi:hypothetical protein